MVCSVRYVPSHAAGIYRRYDRYRTLRIVRYDISTFTGRVGKFDATARPLPGTSVSSVRHRCRYPAATGIDFHVGVGRFGKLRHQSRYDILRQIRYLIQYRYRTLRLVRYDSDTGISGTDMVVSTGAGTGIVAAYIPVPDSPVNSV